jgi:hypothetical protein
LACCAAGCVARLVCMRTQTGTEHPRETWMPAKRDEHGSDARRFDLFCLRGKMASCKEVIDSILIDCFRDELPHSSEVSSRANEDVVGDARSRDLEWPQR